MFGKYTINDVDTAIDALRKIKRPNEDNEGCAINSSSVYNYLSDEDRDVVDESVEIIKSYIRDLDGSPSKKAITTINKRGHHVYLNPDQNDPDRLDGVLQIGDEENDNDEDEDYQENWKVYVGDPSTSTEDDDD